MKNIIVENVGNCIEKAKKLCYNRKDYKRKEEFIWIIKI